MVTNVERDMLRRIFNHDFKHNRFFRLALSSMTKPCALFICLVSLVALSSCSKTPSQMATPVSQQSPPPQISTGRPSGWDPAEACALLMDKLKPGPYKSGNGNVYGCFSVAKDLGAGSPPNSIMFYAGGDAQRARQIGLVLYVNNPENPDEAHKTLLEYSRELSEKALGVPLSRGAENAILAGNEGRGKVDTTKVEVFRKPSANGKGYELHFLITPRL